MPLGPAFLRTELMPNWARWARRPLGMALLGLCTDLGQLLGSQRKVQLVSCFKPFIQLCKASNRSAAFRESLPRQFQPEAFPLRCRWRWCFSSVGGALPFAPALRRRCFSTVADRYANKSCIIKNRHFHNLIFMCPLVRKREPKLLVFQRATSRFQ